MSDVKQDSPKVDTTSLASLAKYIGEHPRSMFDRELAAFLGGIGTTHGRIVERCSMGHQFSSEFEACVEYADAYELAVAWLLSRLDEAR